MLAVLPQRSETGIMRFESPKPTNDALPGFEALASKALRGEDSQWPEKWSDEEETCFLALTTAHGINALLYSNLYRQPSWNTWPAVVQQTLRTTARFETAREILRKAEIIHTLDCLAHERIQPILFKGTPLAYSHYPKAALRPRCDTDALLPHSDLPRLREVMESLGYRQRLSIPGEVVAHQFALDRTDNQGVLHTFDIHWKISNAHPFADVLSYEVLKRDRQLVPSLGANAYAASSVHALLIACIHRVAHHHNTRRMIWLYDVHLLANSFGTHEWKNFADLALDRNVASICLETLEITEDYFATSIPDGYLNDLRASIACRPPEPTRVYLKEDQRRVHRLWRDIASQATLREVSRLLREHALPPPSYMLQRYKIANKALLPFFYVRRLAGAIPKLFRQP